MAISRINKHIDVTDDNFPGIFAAFRAIDLDHGAINRFEPALSLYPVPMRFAGNLSVIDKALLSLTRAELETFCAGEHDEALALITSDSLRKASELLNAYFDGWHNDSRP